MYKYNWLCEIHINGRVCFSEYLTAHEVVSFITGIDILVSTTSNKDGKQHIMISNKCFTINITEL